MKLSVRRTKSRIFLQVLMRNDAWKHCAYILLVYICETLLSFDSALVHSKSSSALTCPLDAFADRSPRNPGVMEEEDAQIPSAVGAG